MPEEEKCQLLIYKVTEAVKEKLHEYLKYIAYYCVILLSIIAWFAITNVHDAIEKVIGDPKEPNELIMKQIKSEVDDYLTKLSPEIKQDTISKIEIMVGKIIKESSEETSRRIDYEIKKMLSEINREKSNKENNIEKINNVENIIADLDSSDWKIRKEAVIKLDKIQYPQAIEILKERLKKEKDQDVLNAIENILKE